MIANTINTTATVRNVFIIDDKGIVRTVLVYPMNVGRCIPEILRIIEALQTSDCNDAATPANWIPNDPIIISAPSTFEELKERQENILKKKNGISWYLSFKNPDCNIKKLECTKIENKNLEKQ